MELERFRKYAPQGVVFDPEEAREILRRYGDLSADQMYTARMRKFNCVPNLMKGAGYTESDASGVTFRRLAEIYSRKCAYNGPRRYSDGLAPEFPSDIDDPMSSLSYLFYDYLPCLKREG